MTVGTDSPAQARSAAPHAPEPPPDPGAQESPGADGTTASAGAGDSPASSASAAFEAFAGVNPDDLPDGLVVADETGRVVCFNAAASRITAVPGDRALGLPSTRHSPWKTSREAAGGP